MGLFKLFIGYLQLFGFIKNNNFLYKVTGSFFNPGPYCGFLSTIIPTALWLSFSADKPYIRHLAKTYIIIAIIILPFLSSRIGWISAITGSALVLSHIYNFNLKKKQNSLYIFIGALLFPLLLYLLWYLKPVSAAGRIFLWRIGISAVLNAPFAGVGWNHVAGALGNAQEEFFRNNIESVSEYNAIGIPQYAFNEYIHIAISWGIPTAIAVLASIIFLIKSALKDKNYGIAGSIVTFAIFAFASYPLQFIQFIILICILSSLVLLSPRKAQTYYYLSIIIICIIGITGIYNTYTRNSNIRKYNNFICTEISEYENLFSHMASNPRFLFDYGMILRKNKRLYESNIIMLKTTEISSDPMPLNIIGRNYEHLKQYHLAEKYYIRASHRMPKLLYPHYLLMKLYGTPGYNNINLMRLEAKTIMMLNPDVNNESMALMRKEAQACLDSLEDQAL